MTYQLAVTYLKIYVTILPLRALRFFIHKIFLKQLHLFVHSVFVFYIRFLTKIVQI